LRKDFRAMLVEAEGLGELFRVVKRAVESVLGVRRAGLELALANLPENVEAVHEVGSNTIIMNRRYLRALLGSSRSKLEIKSRIFSLLLREYLRSLGVNEGEEVRVLSLRVIREALGEDHPAYRMVFEEAPERGSAASYDLEPRDAELVKDFDTDNAHYIG